MWLAPNLITLSGLAFMVVAYLVNAYYLPEYAGKLPRPTCRAAQRGLD